MEKHLILYNIKRETFLQAFYFNCDVCVCACMCVCMCVCVWCVCVFVAFRCMTTVSMKGFSMC